MITNNIETYYALAVFGFLGTTLTIFIFWDFHKKWKEKSDPIKIISLNFMIQSFMLAIITFGDALLAITNSEYRCDEHSWPGCAWVVQILGYAIITSKTTLIVGNLCTIRKTRPVFTIKSAGLSTACIWLFYIVMGLLSFNGGACFVSIQSHDDSFTCKSYIILAYVTKYGPVIIMIGVILCTGYHLKMSGKSNTVIVLLLFISALKIILYIFQSILSIMFDISSQFYQNSPRLSVESQEYTIISKVSIILDPIMYIIELYFNIYLNVKLLEKNTNSLNRGLGYGKIYALLVYIFFD